MTDTTPNMERIEITDRPVVEEATSARNERTKKQFATAITIGIGVTVVLVAVILVQADLGWFTHLLLAGATFFAGMQIKKHFAEKASFWPAVIKTVGAVWFIGAILTSAWGVLTIQTINEAEVMARSDDDPEKIALIEEQAAEVQTVALVEREVECPRTPVIPERDKAVPFRLTLECARTIGYRAGESIVLGVMYQENEPDLALIKDTSPFVEPLTYSRTAVTIGAKSDGFASVNRDEIIFFVMFQDDLVGHNNATISDEGWDKIHDHFDTVAIHQARKAWATGEYQ